MKVEYHTFEGFVGFKLNDVQILGLCIWDIDFTKGDAEVVLVVFS
jgi:hypothetical protein